MSDYEAMLEDFYRDLLRPGDHCVDVGAHLGRHAFPMSRLVKKGGSVHAFEPLPRLASELRRAIAADKSLANVHLTECALSDSAGEAEFVLVCEAPGYSGLRERRYDSEVTTERIRVALRRLDDFLPQLPTIRYIKIDCEGAELLVLRGAMALLKRDRPIVSFECGDSSLLNYDHESGDMFDFLFAEGYRIQSITGEQLDREAFVEANARQSYWDYLAFPM
jgi:FkbM family methyltransferase